MDIYKPRVQLFNIFDPPWLFDLQGLLVNHPQNQVYLILNSTYKMKSKFVNKSCAQNYIFHLKILYDLHKISTQNVLTARPLISPSPPPQLWTFWKRNFSSHFLVHMIYGCPQLDNVFWVIFFKRKSFLFIDILDSI